MATYELSAPDFKTLNDALRDQADKLNKAFLASVAQTSLASPETSEIAKKLCRSRDLRERFAEANAAWIDSE